MPGKSVYVVTNCVWCSKPFRTRRAGLAESGGRRCSPKCAAAGRFDSITVRFYGRLSEPLENGCVVWTGSRTPEGYGKLTLNDETVLMHRFAYELANGPIPDGLLVRHRCDNPPCCNPHHLLLGTTKDNARDAVERGRVESGESRWNSKLTDDDVREMRARYDRGELSTVTAGKEYGVTQTTAWCIVRRRTWKHVV